MEHGTHESFLRGCICAACTGPKPDVYALKVGDRIRFCYERHEDRVAQIVSIDPVVRLDPVRSRQFCLVFSDGSKDWFSCDRLNLMSWVIDDVPSRPPKYSRDEIVGMFT